MNEKLHSTQCHFPSFPFQMYNIPVLCATLSIFKGRTGSRGKIFEKGSFFLLDQQDKKPCMHEVFYAIRQF